MELIKKKIPVIICIAVAFATAAQYYSSSPSSSHYMGAASGFYIIILAFASFLGLVSLFAPHIKRIRFQRDGWGYSVIMFAGVVIGLVTGIVSGAAQLAKTGELTSFGWMYNYMLTPLQGTMFALLAFYAVSASLRFFRVKSWTAGVMLLSAVFVLAGKTACGEALWEIVSGRADMSNAVEWFMNVPAMAARRAIMTGAAAGIIAASARVMLGIEKNYMGKE